MDKLTFCLHRVYLGGKSIDFKLRDYLLKIYGCTAPRLVLRCSRQTEKSTFLANSILFEACTRPGISMLLVAPRWEQARTFCHTRLLPAIEQSPLIRRTLVGRRRRQLTVTNMRFANGSRLHVRAAYQDADSCRGLSVRRLYVDEFQDIAANHLPVLQETLSHAEDGRTCLVGTPKSIDNHLEAAFSQSSANEWTIPCRNCGVGRILDERCLGPHGIVCPQCQSPLDSRKGQWVARNPHSVWGEGFWICHPMVPWLCWDEILERQRVYDPALFKNECLGLPSTLGDHVVTRAELEACCEKYPMANSIEDVPPRFRGSLLAGLDWGGGGVSRTVLAIGFMRSDYRLQICRLERFAAQEEPNRILAEVAQRCAQFHIHAIGADGGGNGHVYNRLLVDKLAGRSHLYAILYSANDQPPWQDGLLWKWSVGRSPSLGAVFSRVKKRMILFPTVRESGSFLDELACEVAEYNAEMRSVKYTHPETLNDDALHAINYLQLLGIRGFHKQSTSEDD